MRTMWKTTIGRVTLATAASAALVVASGCSRSEDWTRVRAAEDPLARTVSLTEAGAPADGSQVLVTCEPHQRTLVRQAVVRGRTVARVECVTESAYADPAAAAPYADPRVIQAREVYEPRVVPAPVYREPAPRVVRTASQRVERAPTRSVKKSAIIIGSSAGVGAGVGAAIGGKKGALIGAAIGGGSAAIWDQVTRR